MALPDIKAFPYKDKDWSVKQIPNIWYKGVFDWYGLYRLCRQWLEENYFKFYEKRYKHKGGELEVDQHGERKLDEMHRSWIYIYFHIWDLQEVEVMWHGQKVKRFKGRIQIKLSAEIEFDYAKRFRGSKLNLVLGRWWMAVRKAEYEANYLEAQSYDLFRLHKDIKTFLNMSTDSNAYQ